MVRNHILWFILFGVVLIYNALQEKYYLLIYYTVWTFILEISYFASKIMHWDSIADHIWPYLYAPAIVVCMGFWIIVAPVHLKNQTRTNMITLVVTHGFNMLAVLVQKKPIYTKDIWKPVIYTVLYNLFLAIYVEGGGRSISGRLPYWYAQYDRPIGWVFAGLACSAAALVHFFLAQPTPKKTTTQYIV